MMAMPRDGYLNQLYHMVTYLKLKHNSEIVPDPTVPDISAVQFIVADWQHPPFGKSKGKCPHNTPKHCGVGFTSRAYVDSDHAGDTIAHRSRTGSIFLE